MSPGDIPGGALYIILGSYWEQGNGPEDEGERRVFGGYVESIETFAERSGLGMRGG